MRRLLTTLFLCLIAGGAMAEGAGLAGKVGLLGFGIEYTQPFSDKLGLRLGANAFTYDYDGSEGGVNYDLELDLSSFTALLDFHPLGGAFRLSIGAMANGNEIVALSQDVPNIQVGDVVFAGDQVGTLRGEVKVDSMAPYAGLGWDWSKGGSGFGIYLDLGVVFQGTPVATLTADGPLASDPLFQQELGKEQDEFNAAIEDFELFPVLGLGFAYRF